MPTASAASAYAAIRRCGLTGWRPPSGAPWSTCSITRAASLLLPRRVRQIREGDPACPDAAALDGPIAKLTRGIARLIDSYAEGLLDKAEFEPRLASFRQRLGALEEQPKAALDQAALQTTLSLLIGRLDDFAGTVRRRLAEADWTQQRDLIRLLVKRVEIAPDAVNIVFRITPLSHYSCRDGPTAPFLQDCGRRDSRGCRESSPR
jgi:hypothetical protein